MKSDRDRKLESYGLGEAMMRVPMDRVWSSTVGLEYWPDPDEEHVQRAQLPITERVCQPMGLVHGGIYACIAEELASVGTGRAVMAEGKWCVGMSNLTHFLRPGTLGGTLHAVARPVHRGRTTWVWEVETSNEHGKLCAKTTVTMAVREGEAPAPPA